MTQIRVIEKPEACQELWQRLWPQTGIFDLWPVRACFMKHYQRPPYFLIDEQDSQNPLFMALAWIEEEGYFGHFPGETWQGKTWLEQNKIIGAGSGNPQVLLEKVPGKVFLRYLDGDFLFSSGSGFTIDEVGYLFVPSRFDFSFDTYRQSFPGKTRKKIDQEIRRLQVHPVTWRYDRPADVDAMVDMNLAAFGEYSYFHDPRFFQSFIDLIAFLKQNNMLRITSVLIGDHLAAVDVGVLWKNTYTVMAGGTNPEFPGVAKMINFHHIEWACRQRLSMIDFLCGDFAWKTRFRLQPRPLFQLCFPEAGHEMAKAPVDDRSTVCVA